MVQSDRIAFLSSGIAPIIHSRFSRCSVKISRSFYHTKVLDRKPIKANLRAIQQPTTTPKQSASVSVTPTEKVTTVLTFQEAIQRLSAYWASKGCIIWHPYNVEVGAGTMNPATFLRVLGPEPWSIAYDEPSIRPDDSRYGENPNRLQRHTQFQVIVKPAPDCAQELVVGSYQALGIDTCRNDIRFVEDNWESPALGAWGLGWEIWLNGMEVTQFTYFQQAGGITLDSVSLEVTYGLERIIMALQGKTHFKDIIYAPGITYGDIFVQNEIEMSKYNLDDASIDRNKEMFQLYEAEAQALLEKDLPIPAYNYVLKASHTFNILDSRGAIGVTERARYFQRMRTLSRDVAHAWLNRREEIGFPLLTKQRDSPKIAIQQSEITHEAAKRIEAADFVLEIGLEELPAGDVSSTIEQVHVLLTGILNESRLSYSSVEVNGTPRRVLALVRELQTRQLDETKRVRGPPLRVALKDGELTKAGIGFMRSQGVSLDALDSDEGEGYMYATVEEKGRSAEAVLAGELPSGVLERISFGKSMRWNDTAISFSRPIRWLLCLLDDQVIPFSYAGVVSSNATRSLRGADGFAKTIPVPSASDCIQILKNLQIVVSRDERSKQIRKEAEQLAKAVGGVVPDEYLNGALLEEITDLVENPIPLSGSFDEHFLNLPKEVLETVMKKHQRYLPIVHAESGRLMNSFITVANGDPGEVDVDMIRKGNEAVLRARYSDAAFFYENDTNEKRLNDFVPHLSGLTFQEKLGSMLDKTKRVQSEIRRLSKLLGLNEAEIVDAEQVAKLFKADLATSMVIEMTSLAGTIGRHYAIKSGEVSKTVCDAILEASLPRFSGDQVAQSKAGAAVAIADRIDSLVGLFSVGLMPKSTADPYALRRAALGIVQTLVAVKFDVNISDLVRIAAESIEAQIGEDVAINTQASVLEFISKRLEGYLLDNVGFADDIVKGALAVERNRNNPLSAISVCNVLHHLTKTDKQLLAQAQEAYSRAARLLGAVKDMKVEELLKTDISEHLFDCDQERSLFEALQNVNRRKENNLGIEEVTLSKIKSLVSIKATIDEFFDSVFVNTEDPSVRRNRLSLCARIVGMTSELVDLSLLV